MHGNNDSITFSNTEWAELVEADKQQTARIRALEAALRDIADSDACMYATCGGVARRVLGLPENYGYPIITTTAETTPEFDPAWVCGVCGKRHGQGECLGMETGVAK